MKIDFLFLGNILQNFRIIGGTHHHKVACHAQKLSIQTIVQTISHTEPTINL